LKTKPFYSPAGQSRRENKKQPLTAVQKKEWVDDKEAMLLLKIKSRTTLQHLRDEGKIRFSQPQKRVILYDRLSIAEYLEKHAKDTF